MALVGVAGVFLIPAINAPLSGMFWLFDFAATRGYIVFTRDLDSVRCWRPRSL